MKRPVPSKSLCINRREDQGTREWRGKTLAKVREGERGGLDGFHPRCSGAQFQGQEQAAGQSFGTCLVGQTVRRRGPEVAAEGRSVLIAEETAMSMERSDGGLA